MSVRRILVVLAPLTVVACSDYNFKDHGDISQPGEVTEDDPGTDTDPPVGTPIATVSPGSVDLGVVCGSGFSEVVVENVGDAELDVTRIDTDSPSWSAVHDTLPITLAPGDQLTISLSGAPVDTTMVIETTDPAHPELRVPLTGTADVAPTLTITSPTTGSVLDVGAVTTFEATVSDDAGPADAVSLEWVSDIDGVLGTDSADGSGVASLAWDANAQTSGSHVVTLTATDTCGNVTSADVVVCQNEGYLAENLDLATWNFEGHAHWDSANSWVRLTAPNTYESGTAFQTAATVDASNVQVDFDFYASGGTGADGLSVTALDSTRMTSFVGSAGGGIGYGGLPGWSIEVDTWYNGGADPTEEDHVSVHIDGDTTNPVVWAALPEMEDGNWHRMSVNVSGTWMTVEIDGVAYIDQDVSQISSFPAYVGFTAATGSVTNDHLIDALEVEEFVCGE
mgnify:FL=1